MALLLPWPAGIYGPSCGRVKFVCLTQCSAVNPEVQRNRRESVGDQGLVTDVHVAVVGLRVFVNLTEKWCPPPGALAGARTTSAECRDILMLLWWRVCFVTAFYTIRGK